MPSARNHAAVVWLPLLVWTALVFLFSSDAFSSSNTAGFLARWLQALFGDLSQRTIDAANFITRKLAHLVAYGILAVLAFRAWRASRAGGRFRWAGLALVYCLVIASIDEANQAFSGVRSGTVKDVALDLTGGVLALASYYVIRRMWRLVRPTPGAPPPASARP